MARKGHRADNWDANRQLSCTSTLQQCVFVTRCIKTKRRQRRPQLTQLPVSAPSCLFASTLGNLVIVCPTDLPGNQTLPMSCLLTCRQWMWSSLSVQWWDNLNCMTCIPSIKYSPARYFYTLFHWSKSFSQVHRGRRGDVQSDQVHGVLNTAHCAMGIHQLW